MEKYLIAIDSTLGCDPELFLTDEKGVVGSETVLPKKGIDVCSYSSKVITDGVQIELNPHPSSCRESLGQFIGSSFVQLRRHLNTLQAKGQKISASFDSVIEMDPEVLDKLSADAKKLGCAPSLNIGDKGKGVVSTIGVDPSTYLKRSAGGHIHIGMNPDFYPFRERLVPILDLVVGNTSVLMDRDPLSSERRKVYGRAGEYRLPKHGLEYRTLSNFWLRNYVVYHLVMGLVRMSTYILWTSLMDPECSPITPVYYMKEGDWDRQKGFYRMVWVPLRQFTGWDTVGELFDDLPYERVVEAINTNNLDLARENFEHVKGFILKHVQQGNGGLGLNPHNLKQFEYFCEEIEKKGMERWFKQSPMDHWCGIPDVRTRGSESWLSNIAIPSPSIPKSM